MRKSDLQTFGSPTRQSLVAILLIILKTYRLLIRQVWPFLLLYLVKSKESSTQNYFLIAGVVIAVLGMIYSIVNYFRYYFYIKQDELIVESGIFKRSKLNVPFDRIQTINFEQNIIHRIFNVVRLNIDTAGSAKAEFKFDALSHEKAGALRNLLLEKKSKSIVHKTEEEAVEEEKFKTIMKLDIGDLLKAGAVENHLKSGGLIIAFLFWIWQSLQDAQMGKVVGDRVEEQMTGGLILFGSLLILFIILSFLISLVRMVLINYNLQFLRSENGFKLNAGLFTRKDTSALDHKIQVLSWGDNPLMKLLGIKNLRLKQASSIAVTKKTSIKVPSCKQEHIDLVTNALFGENALDGIEYQKIDKRYFYRNAIIVSALFSLLISGVVYFELYVQGGLLLLLAGVLLFSLYLSFRKKKYGNNEEMLVIQGGTYGNKVEVMPLYKIQSISLHQTPYQSRNALANLTIHTASGKVGIPYIDKNEAQRLMDLYLYKVENDKRTWL